MRRADRLFQIVQILRARRLTTARQLAERLEVSERTVYRDIQDLSLSGVPILGEAGVGYTLKRGYDLPPLMFDYDEVEALVLGARMVAAWTSTPLATSAHQALEKIAAVLPERRRDAMEKLRVFVPAFHIAPQLGACFEVMRRAVREQTVLDLTYRTESGSESCRTVRPLAVYFWGERWTLAAWCELRDDFRNFRLDRMTAASPLPRTFASEPGKTLEDFLNRMEPPGSVP